MKYFRKIVQPLVATAALCVVGCQKPHNSSNAQSTSSAAKSKATPPQIHKVTFSGTVALSSNVSDGDIDNLAINDPVPGATVFLKDAPDQAVKANAVGAFTISLVVQPSSSLADATTHPNYDVVIWYTTPNAQHRFGILKNEAAEPDQSVELGQVQLSYTRKAAFILTDSSGTPIPAYADGQTCTVTFPGYEGKIIVTAAGGQLTGDYIPPADYSVVATCLGYQTLTSSVSILPVTNFTDVQTVSLALLSN